MIFNKENVEFPMNLISILLCDESLLCMEWIGIFLENPFVRKI